jgi:hypothetical protein
VEPQKDMGIGDMEGRWLMSTGSSWMGGITSHIL